MSSNIVSSRSGDQMDMKIYADQPPSWSVFSSSASIQALEIDSRLERPLERPLGGHGRGGRLDGGVIHHRGEAAQKRFWTKGEDRAGGRVYDGTFLGAKLQVKGKSRHGKAGQNTTRWRSVQPDPTTMALQSDGVCGEDSDMDAELLSLRPLLKPQKSMVMYLINSGDEVGAPTSLKAMAVRD